MTETQVSCFFYADEIAIIVDDPDHLQLMLAACDEYAASRDTLAHRTSASSSLTQTSANSHSMVTELTRSQSLFTWVLQTTINVSSKSPTSIASW